MTCMMCSTMMIVIPESRTLRISFTPSRLFLGRESGHGFIQQQELGAGGQGTRDFQPLAVADGEPFGRVVLLFGQFAELEHLQGLVPGFAACDPVRLKAEVMTFSSTVMRRSGLTIWKVLPIPMFADLPGGQSVQFLALRTESFRR